MGATASGKTDVAISLRKRFPCDIISVDSALVYRGMDIGTAKPDAETLRRVPHRLIDIRDPEEVYSAGDFVRDARGEMEAIYSQGRVPLLVGGTLMYFRALNDGIAELPSANADIRATIDAEAEQIGWPAMHKKLFEIDPVVAKRVAASDRQRIQRALEVYLASGKPLSEWQEEAVSSVDSDVRIIKLALQPATRMVLHERIEERLNSMLNNGFLEEVKVLHQRERLTAQHPSMRSVGYRQLWQYLDGECTLQQARDKALFATRQLAKRQITWLRSESELHSFDPLEAGAIDAISSCLIEFFNA